MQHGSPARLGRFRIRILVIGACLLAALWGSSALAQPLTWQDSYSWPAGDGYAGWSSFDGGADWGAYAFGAPLAGMSGLSLWLPGDRWYNPGAAEWRLDAPGTTRIASASLHLAYRDNLFAHHCLELGLRDAKGPRDSSRTCSPPALPATEDDYSVTLRDPAASSMSNQAYLRVEFPPCHNPRGNGCPKWIPSLDPAANAPLVRLESVELTLVDDDLPTATASGPLADSADGYIGGQRPLDLSVAASDAGSGVSRFWVEAADGTRLAAASADCDPGHHRPDLGAAVCPANAGATLAVPTNGLPDGLNTLNAGASDLAGNEGRSAAWTVYVDRTAPAAPSNIQSDFDEDTSATLVSWDDGSDPDLADGSTGSGIGHDEYRVELGAGQWSDWQSTTDRGFVLPGVQPGDEITTEVRTVDNVGNASASTSEILGVDGPVGDDQPDDGDPGPSNDYAEPDLVASAASVSDVDLAAAMPCRSHPSEFFYPTSQPGNGGVARITRLYNHPGQPRITKFNPFNPTLPKCRYAHGGTRDVGAFYDNGKLRHFSAQRRLGYLDTRAHNANGVYVRDSFAEEIMKVKYVRGWTCAGDQINGHNRYNLTIYRTPGDLSHSTSVCADVLSAKPPRSLILQGRACITGVHHRDAWAMVAIGLHVPGDDVNIRGFVPNDVVPSKDRSGKDIDMSALPDTGCGGAGNVTDPTTFTTNGVAKFYYRQDNASTPTSSYENYNGHDLGGRVDDAYAYQYVVINTTAVSGGGIARAVIPSNRLIDQRDNFAYCDPNGAGALDTIQVTQTAANGKPVQVTRLSAASVKPRVSWNYGEVRSAASGHPGTHIYGWVPLSSLDGATPPNDPDCRADDVFTFDHADPANDYAHFFDVPAPH